MWFGWGWGIMFLIPLCFIIGATVIYYFLIGSRRNCHNHYTRRYQSISRASDILAERYARGEISREEFKQIKKELDR